MIIDVARLPQDGMDIEGEEPSAIFALGDDEYVKFDKPVQYCLNVVLVSDELIIKGKVGVEALFRCSRCSEYFPLFIEEKDFLHAVELAPDAQSVDLTEDIREAMLLLFPAYPVCSKDCRGLCAQCGVNFNEGSCNCEKPADARWGALDDLEISEE